jgi:hypothetical protein
LLAAGFFFGHLFASDCCSPSSVFGVFFVGSLLPLWFAHASCFSLAAHLSFVAGISLTVLPHCWLFTDFFASVLKNYRDISRQERGLELALQGHLPADHLDHLDCYESTTCLA